MRLLSRKSQVPRAEVVSLRGSGAGRLQGQPPRHTVTVSSTLVFNYFLSGRHPGFSPNTEVCLESFQTPGNREMCFQADFDEADSCEAILDKKYGLLLMSRVGRFLRLSSACPVISVPGGEAVSFLWSTLQEGQEFSKGPFMGGGQGKNDFASAVFSTRRRYNLR